VSAVAARTLIVEARDLDTDERTVVTLEVSMPPDAAAQRAQMAEAVGQLHPEARLRSFGGGAASFLDSQQLVVAHYGATSRRPDAPRPADPVVQEQLFGADAP
jgi:hypothetical protein